MAEQYITVISLKHQLLNCIQENNKIAHLLLIVSYFPNSSDEQILILLQAVYLFLQAAPTSKISLFLRHLSSLVGGSCDS